MSSFLTKDDYSSHIKNYVLDAVSNTDDRVIEKVEAAAIKYVRGYLKMRFKVDEIFAATGNDRDEMVVSIVLDIALFKLHQRHNPRKIPTFRKEAYNEAKKWLEDARDGLIEPDGLPLLEEQEVQSVIEIRSNPKRHNHI